MQALIEYFNYNRDLFNQRYSSTEPLKLVLFSASSAFLISYFYHFIYDSREDPSTRLKKSFFRLIRLVPQVKNKIETELAEAKVKLEKDLVVSVPGEKFHLTLPEEGLSAKEIEAELEIIHKMGTSDYNNGRVSVKSKYFFKKKNQNLM